MNLIDDYCMTDTIEYCAIVEFHIDLDLQNKNISNKKKTKLKKYVITALLKCKIPIVETVVVD